MQMEKAAVDSEQHPGSFIIYMKCVLLCVIVCVCVFVCGVSDTNMIYKKR